MPRKKKDPKPVITKKHEPTLSERIMSISFEEEARKQAEITADRERQVRAMIENTKSFLQLGQTESEGIEVYESDGGYYVHYDDLDIAPLNPRMVFLVWDCDKCGEKTTSLTASKSWVELGDQIRLAKSGGFEPTREHVCQE